MRIRQLFIVGGLMASLLSMPASAHPEPDDGVNCRLRDDAHLSKNGLYARGTLKIKNDNVSYMDPNGNVVDGDREVVATVVVHNRKHKKAGSNVPFNNYYVESNSADIYKWEALIDTLRKPHHVHLLHCHTF